MLYNPPTGSNDPNAPYVGKNPAAGTQGSKVPPAAVEYTQREIVNLIAASDQAPTNDDNQQLLKGIRSGVLEFYFDTGTADALVITPNPPFSAIPDGATFTVAKGNAPNATTTPALAVNGLSQPVVKEDGSAPGGGDLPANSVFQVRSLAGKFHVLGLRKSDAAAAAGSSTTVSMAVQNFVIQNTDAGLTPLSAFTSNKVADDVAVSPAFTQVQQTGYFTGAIAVRVSGQCGLRNNTSANSLAGGTVRYMLYDSTTGQTVGYSQYLGGGSSTTGVQLPFSPAPHTFQGLDPTHHYNIGLEVQKGSSDGALQVFDPSLDLLHNGTNI